MLFGLTAIAEATALFLELVRHRLRTLAFFNSRKLTETVLTSARAVLRGDRLETLINAYRWESWGAGCSVDA